MRILKIMGLLLLTLAITIPSSAFANEGSWKASAMFTGYMNAGQKFNIVELEDQGLTSTGLGFDLLFRHSKKAFGSIMLTFGPGVAYTASGRSKPASWKSGNTIILEAQLSESHLLLPGFVFGIDMGEKVMGLAATLDTYVGPRWVTAQYSPYPTNSTQGSVAPVTLRGNGVAGRIGLGLQMRLFKLGEAGFVTKLHVGYAFGNVVPMAGGTATPASESNNWGLHGRSFNLILGADRKSVV